WPGRSIFAATCQRSRRTRKSVHWSSTETALSCLTLRRHLRCAAQELRLPRPHWTSRMLFDLWTWRTASPLFFLKSLEIRSAQHVSHVIGTFCNPWPSQIHDTETMHFTSQFRSLEE